jgi:micrococcal nuclease
MSTKAKLYHYRAIVRRVVDGDTIDVDIDLGFDTWMMDQRVRLNGVDTPEVRTKDLLEKDAGLLAKAKVEELLPVGTECVIKTEYRDKDKFGRILATFCFPVDGEEVDLNQFLIENNYAVSYHGQSKQLIEAAHLKNYSILKQRGEIDGIV